MHLVKELIEFIFSAALFINALLFVPQSIRIIREKSAKGVSLFTFLGLLLIQLTIVLHGIITHDMILIVGYIVSMISCGSVVILVLIYKRKQDLTNSLSDRDIINQIPCHIYWKDKEGILLGCNTSNWKDFGLTSEKQFIGKTDYDLFPSEQAEKLRLIDDKVIKNERYDIVEEHISTEKGLTTYLSHKVPLRDKKGNVIGVLGVSCDVTERNRKIANQLQMLENIIAVMPGNVYWLNKEGIYLGCNDNQAKMIGLNSRKDIVGKRNVELPGFLIPEVLDKYNQQVIETGKAIIVEEPAVLPSGEDAIFLSSKVPLRDADKSIIGIIGISIDITERKQQEAELRKAKDEAEASNKIKQEFISNMEHDIRTPFVGIYGMIDLLAKQEKDDAKREILNDVSMCAKELMDYCDGILDFSKIESESFPIVSKTFSLRETIDSVIAIEEVAARNKSLKFNFTFDDNIPDIVKGDKYRLKRILINLLSNAIKFTNEGGLSLSTSLHETNDDSRQLIVKFVVEDTGIGIPDDKKSLVYERFTKVLPSNKGLYKGLGLGLRIVKQFVDELGGDIHLRSEINKGTAFVVYLPFQIPLSTEIIDE